MSFTIKKLSSIVTFANLLFAEIKRLGLIKIIHQNRGLCKNVSACERKAKKNWLIGLLIPALFPSIEISFKIAFKLTWFSDMLQLSRFSENLLENGSKCKPRDTAPLLPLWQEFVKASAEQEDSLNKAFQILQNWIILLITNSWNFMSSDIFSFLSFFF